MPRDGGIAAAALLLPGLAALLAPAAADAQPRPEQATLSVRYGDYRDAQPGWNRVRARSPQLALQAPVAQDWLLDVSAVADSVSGATPRLHTQRSSASTMSDHRQAGEVKVTRYLPRASYSVSLGSSDENDYRSRSLGVQGRWSSDDNNRIWSLGFGLAADRIDGTTSGAPAVVDQHRRTREFQASLTQVLTRNDIAQLTVTRSLGRGFYSDPYKLFDRRPDKRDAWIVLARWNHHIEPLDASVRASWRFHDDSFGIRSHTAGLEWVQPAGAWTFTPGVRYSTQNAASFFFAPVLTSEGAYDATGTLRKLIATRGASSADQRLAAWGAVTWSMQVAYAFSEDTSADVKVESYRQSAALRPGGGTAGLDRFQARWLQVGLTHRF